MHWVKRDLRSVQLSLRSKHCAVKGCKRAAPWVLWLLGTADSGYCHHHCAELEQAWRTALGDSTT